MKTKKLSNKVKKNLNDAGYEDTWVATQHKISRKAFETKAEEFISIMHTGSGIENIHMIELIRGLEWDYIKAAAYKAAMNEIQVDITD
jgi:hypothetical protein